MSTSGYIFLIIHASYTDAQTGSFEYNSAACLSVIFELLPGLILLASLRNAG